MLDVQFWVLSLVGLTLSVFSLVGLTLSVSLDSFWYIIIMTCGLDTVRVWVSLDYLETRLYSMSCESDTVCV